MTTKEFEQQFIPLSGMVESYLKRICNDQHLIEDIVQEVYLKLWKNRKRLPIIKEAKAYLFKVARNSLIDSGYYEQKRISYNNELINEKLWISNDSTDQLLEQKEMVKLLTQLMEQLPAIQKEIVHLRDFCCFNNDEVAKIIGESEVYVRVNLSRGRKQLREMMIKNYQIEKYEIR